MRSAMMTAAALLMLGGCGDQPAGEAAEDSPVNLAERRGAYRQACVAEDLAAQAEDDILTLEEVAAGAGSDPVASLSARAAESALEFSRAYQRHAELRAAAYAHLDSAINHSVTTADSARYAQRAESFSIRAPQAGTVEENVFLSYQTNFIQLLQDEDYPCNWDLPF